MLFLIFNVNTRQFFINLQLTAHAGNAVHVFYAEAAEPLNMVGMGESPCYVEMLLFDCGRSRTFVMR